MPTRRRSSGMVGGLGGRGDNGIGGTGSVHRGQRRPDRSTQGMATPEPNDPLDRIEPDPELEGMPPVSFQAVGRNSPDPSRIRAVIEVHEHGVSHGTRMADDYHWER